MQFVTENILRQPFRPKEFALYLSQLRSRTDLIINAAVSLEENSTALLKALHTPEVSSSGHTIGIAFVLGLQAQNLPEGAYLSFVSACKSFFEQAHKDQINFVQKEVVGIVFILARLACRMGIPRTVILSVRQAVELLAPSKVCLTAAHANFLQVCIAGQMYGYAVDFIRNTDIYEINTPVSFVTGEDVLRYFYYCGICFIAVKDFASALECFHQCMTTPANALSQIVICAIKKAKLVSLIESGEAFNVPSCTPVCVTRFCKRDMPVYDEMVRCFLQNDHLTLATMVNTNDQVIDMLNRDQNMGIAQQMLTAWSHHCIRKLSLTYTNLSLQDIAKHAALPTAAAAEKCILQLVRQGVVTVRIDAVTGNVCFIERGSSDYTTAPGSSSNVNNNHDDDASKEELRCIMQLERSIHSTLILSDKLHEMQKKVLTSKPYIAHTYCSSSAPTSVGTTAYHRSGSAGAAADYLMMMNDDDGDDADHMDLY